MPAHRCLAFLLLSALAAQAPAAEVDRFLPADAEIVVTVNVRQMLDSSLIKEQALDLLRDGLKSLDMAEDILKELGFDPFKDLDRIVAGGPAGKEPDRGLLIVHGRFDVAKFKAKAEESAKTFGDALKVLKVPDGLGGNFVVYQVSPPEMPAPVFVALAGKDTLLASPGKDYVVDALRRQARKEPVALKDKVFQEMLEKLDDKQSISFAATGPALANGALQGTPAADSLAKIIGLGGGITLSEDLKIEAVVTSKTAAEANELHEAADKGLKLALTFLAALTQGNDNNPGLDLALEVVKGFRVQVKDKSVLIKGRLSADTIADALKKIK
jgi:hypothetical protein